jgi:hypothetical protein
MCLAIEPAGVPDQEIAVIHGALTERQGRKSIRCQVQGAPRAGHPPGKARASPHAWRRTVAP